MDTLGRQQRGHVWRARGPVDTYVGRRQSRTVERGIPSRRAISQSFTPAAMSRTASCLISGPCTNVVRMRPGGKSARRPAPQEVRNPGAVGAPGLGELGELRLVGLVRQAVGG